MFIVKSLLTGIHVITSILLVVVILLQSSKGGGLSGTFGGGGGQAASFLGARGTSTVLSKVTNYLAGIFLVLSFSLSMMAGAGTALVSVTQKVLEATPAAFLPEIEDLTLGNDANAVNDAAIPQDGSDEPVLTPEESEETE